MEQTKEIQYLNKVELTGRVGAVRTNTVGAVALCRFTLATQRIYLDKDGSCVEETQWHDVSFFGKKGQKEPAVRKGDAVHIVGRIRMNRYTGSDGETRAVPEIIASSLDNYGSETRIVPEGI